MLMHADEDVAYMPVQLAVDESSHRWRTANDRHEQCNLAAQETTGHATEWIHSCSSRNSSHGTSVTHWSHAL